MRENEYVRAQMQLYKEQNPYDSVNIPDKVEPVYGKAELGFRVANVLDFYIEPVAEKNMILNIQGRGEMRFAYNPLLLNKLELLFHGE